MARAEGFSEMPKYRFNPPLTLKGGVVVRTLDDAVAFVRSYRDPHLPKSSAAVLLSIEEAHDKNAELRKAGITRPLMEEIEKRFAAAG